MHPVVNWKKIPTSLRQKSCTAERCGYCLPFIASSFYLAMFSILVSPQDDSPVGDGSDNMFDDYIMATTRYLSFFSITCMVSSLNIFFFVPVCSNVQNLIKIGVGIIYYLRGFALLLEENS